MKRKNINLMYAITFFQGIVIYATISTLYREQRGMSLSDYAIVESFLYLFILIFEVPFGYLADRIGYKKTLVISNGIYFLSKIVFWKANGIPMFLLERLLMAISFAGISGVDTSILYLSSEKDRSQKIFGFYGTFGTAGMLFGSLLFTLFLSNNYSACAFGTMIAYGIAFILTLLLDEVKGKAEIEEKANANNILSILKISLKDTKFLGFLLSAALMSNASWMISVMLNQDKFILLGLKEQYMGVIAIIISVAGLFSFSSSIFTKKLGFNKFLSYLCVLMGIAGLVMGYTHLVIVAILCNFIVDFGYGLVSPVINELENERVCVKDRATQLSVYGMIIDVISIGLSIVTSLVAKISFTSIFVLVFIECLIAIIFINICYKQKK